MKGWFKGTNVGYIGRAHTRIKKLIFGQPMFDFAPTCLLGEKILAIIGIKSYNIE